MPTMEIRDRENAERRLLTPEPDEPEVTALLSLLDPAANDPAGFWTFPHSKKLLNFCDSLPDEWQGEAAATVDHINQIIRFGVDNRLTDHVLIHCHGGIGRSTAAGFIIQCVWWGPGTDAEWSALNLALSGVKDTRKPHPNEHMVALADELLGRDGRMVRTMQEVQAGQASLYR